MTRTQAFSAATSMRRAGAAPAGMRLLLGVLLGTWSFAAMAALPPQYQRLVEFQAIFQDEKVVDAFPNAQLIERVEYVDRDLYRVSAGDCFLHIEVKDKPRPELLLGPRLFELVIGAAQCPED